MPQDTIIQGETYDISVQIKDADGDPVVIDGTWLVACRFTLQALGGPTVVEPTMIIAAGVATCSIDTGDAPWLPTTYFYDIRLTDPAGNDYWTDPVTLVLRTRNTPAS